MPSVHQRYSFGGVDLVTANRLIAPSFPSGGLLPLRQCEGLRWDGLRRTPHLVPAPGPSELKDLGSSSDGTPRAAAWHVRQRRGDLDTLVEPLERLVILTDAKIFLIYATVDTLPLSSTNVTQRTLHTFTASATRSGSFAQVGETLVLAVRGSDGAPEFTFMLVDDTLMALTDSNEAGRVPPRPFFNRSRTRIDEEGLVPAYYGLAWAYCYDDGTVGPISPPIQQNWSVPTSASDGVVNAAVAVGLLLVTVTGTAILDDLKKSEEYWDVYVGDPRARISFDQVAETYIVDSYAVTAGNVDITLASPLSAALAGAETVTAVRGFEATFTIGSGYTASFDTDRDELIRGFCIYMTAPLTDENDFANSPLFKVAEITSLTALAASTYSDLATKIVGRPSYEGGSLTAHAITAGACYSFNGRLYLGDVSYDFYKPTDEYFILSGSTNSFRMRVQIDTANGTFYRYSDVFTDSSTTIPTFGFINYPDARASEMVFYLDTGGGVYEEATTLKLEPSEVLDVAYIKTSSIALVATGVAMPSAAVVTAANLEVDRDRNRVLASGSYRPFDLRAEGAAYVGDAERDGVVAFATSQTPLSRGQFGEFPIFIFNSGSVWSWQPSETSAAPLSVMPVTTDRGIVGPNAVRVVSGNVFFAASDGIYILGQGVESEALTANLIVTTSFGTDTALGLYRDADRTELWLTSGEQVWAYSLRHLRFSRIETDTSAALIGTRYVFVNASPGAGDTLYSLSVDASSDPTLWIEGGSTASVPVELKTVPLWAHGRRERMRRLYLPPGAGADLTYTITDLDPSGASVVIGSGNALQQTLGTAIGLTHNHAWSPEIYFTATLPQTAVLDGIEVEAGIPRPHKARQYTRV